MYLTRLRRKGGLACSTEVPFSGCLQVSRVAVTDIRLNNPILGQNLSA